MRRFATSVIENPSPMNALILIPARLAATRLPGKPLADINGAPMIVHVARRAAESGLGRVVVATDSREVAEAVTGAGFEVAMTRADHQSGSDRIFEALTALDPDGRVDTIVNLQHKNLDAAIQAQEKCLEYGQLFNGGLLLEMYKMRLARLKKEGKDEKDPLYRQTLMNAQELIRRANAGLPPR